MNSRERILAAINHQWVDRVPIDFGGTRQSGISVWAYARLRKHLGLDTNRPPRVFDTFQMLAEIEQDVAESFGADCIALNRPAVAFGIRNDNWKVFAFPEDLSVEVAGGFEPEPDGSGGLVLRRNGDDIAAMPAKGFYFDRLEKYPGAVHPDLTTWRVPRIDAQSTFAHGTPEQVAAETEANLEAFIPGSGYVCAPIHNIQANVPAENIVALFQTALNFRIKDSH